MTTGNMVADGIDQHLHEYDEWASKNQSVTHLNVWNHGELSLAEIEESNLGPFLKHIKKTGYPFQYVLDADLGEFLDSDELTSYSVETIYF
ncbi:hypothetical protein FEFB_09450 [Fructobacillus sp. EFB-N1]|uniref:hypothetical protein n=1 Tax=Fructobacillus sp. EFB-N1 TaxID=1658766 RepID=UPI00064DA1CD|nr:hypothetical protein [Fructobacillus sp. EFB-N1]KMK53275.1 hypothetical protein FEFB_09450 [Fructobacillus sp. EFB-N1]